MIQKLNILFIISFLFTQSIYSQKEYRLNNVKFIGNNHLSNEMLLKQMNTQPKKKIEKLLIWKRNPEFTKFVLENDINRLKTFYNRNGFLTPKISYKLDTLRFNRINVFINIEENNFVKVGEVNLKFKGDSLDVKFIGLLTSKIILHPGQRFVDEHVFKSVSSIQQTFADNGYPFSKTNYHIQVKQDSLVSDIDFDIHSGEKSFIGDISIHGDSIVPKKIIEKNIEFETGDIYKQKIIDKTQQEIFNTELFQYVIIRSLKNKVKLNHIPVEIHVQELPRWNFETGVGYGTDDKLRLSMAITKLNFLGGTRKLIFKAKTSYYTPYNFDVKFIQPNFFIQDLDFIINPFYVKEREKSYEIERLGGGLTFQYQLNKNLSTDLTYTIEKDNILEISDLQLNPDDLKHNKGMISWGTQFNSTNNFFNPTKGLKLKGNVTYSGLGFNTKFHYYRLDLSLKNYYPVSSEITLATKLIAGVMQAIQNDPETPIGDRYFAGGASSLRGWARHEIYPENIESTAIGGNTLFEGSVELRYPIYDIFKGAFFVDFGNVWTNSYSYNFSKLHYNTGIGLRVETPIGPIRLDMATPVINDDFRFQFFISIGHAF